MAYRHLTMEERCNIKFLWEQGLSLRSIARHLGRSASTVIPERRRIGGPSAYAPRTRLLEDPVWLMAVQRKLEVG